MNQTILNYYVVEYSLLQNCFHCDTFEKVISKNINLSKDKTINDYKIIGIFKTLDDAMNYIKKCDNLNRETISDNESKIDKLIKEIEKLIIQ